MTADIPRRKASQLLWTLAGSSAARASASARDGRERSVFRMFSPDINPIFYFDGKWRTPTPLQSGGVDGDRHGLRTILAVLPLHGTFPTAHAPSAYGYRDPATGANTMARRPTITENRRVLAANRYRHAFNQLLARGHDLRDLLRILYHRMQDTLPLDKPRAERESLAVRMSIVQLPRALRRLRNQLRAFEIRHALVSGRRYIRKCLREVRGEYADHEADAFADRVERSTYNFISRDPSTYTPSSRWLQDQLPRVETLISFTYALLDEYAAWDAAEPGFVGERRPSS